MSREFSQIANYVCKKGLKQINWCETWQLYDCAVIRCGGCFRKIFPRCSDPVPWRPIREARVGVCQQGEHFCPPTLHF